MNGCGGDAFYEEAHATPQKRKPRETVPASAPSGGRLHLVQDGRVLGPEIGRAAAYGVPSGSFSTTSGQNEPALVRLAVEAVCRANKVRDEGAGGPVVDLTRRADLRDATVAHNDDAIT